LENTDQKQSRVTRKVVSDKTKKRASKYAIESNALARASHLNVTKETKDTEHKKIIRRRTDEVSIWEARLRVAILCQVYPETDFQQPIKISMSELSAQYNVDGRTYELVRSAAERLITYFRELVDVDKKKFTLVTYFSEISYERGVVTAYLNPKLREHLIARLQNGHFTRLEYAEFRPLVTVSGQWLFEYLSTYRYEGKKFIPLSELHRILNATKYQQEHYGEFYRQVLKPALEDIRDHSGWIDLDWTPTKEGKKYSGLELFFKPNLKPAEEIIGVDINVNAQEHAKWQRLSNNCADEHERKGTVCKPGHGKKCTFCTTRGRMYAKKMVEKYHAEQQNPPLE